MTIFVVVILLVNSLVLHRSLSTNTGSSLEIPRDDCPPEGEASAPFKIEMNNKQNDLPSLQELASIHATKASCNRTWISNSLSSEISDATNPTRIPKIVHQTAKTHCMTQMMAKMVSKWNFGGWSYILHDDNAVRRLLFASGHDSFSHLPSVASHCLPHGTLMADLWRYVVLWHYGGIYVDIDAVPAKFDPAVHLTGDVEALFVVEQYHILSQWFMVVRPHHPLMLYAIQESLLWLLNAADTGAAPPSVTTGPHALHRALMRYIKDAGGTIDPLMAGMKPVHAGTYRGTRNTTITVLGTAANQNEYVNRDVLMRKKFREYAKVGMRHFSEDKKHPTGRSCLSLLAEHAASIV